MAIYCKKNRSGAWESTDSTTFDNLPDDEKCSSRTETTCNFCGTATGVYCVKNRAGNWESVSKVDYDRRTNDDEKCESSTETTCDFCSTPTPDPTPPTPSYTECEGGPYKKGCKDPDAGSRRPNPSGMIYKLQGCIGVYQDSFFGPKTRDALKDATGKTYINNDSEIEALCKTVDQGQEQEGPVKGTVQYWNDLIDREVIYGEGLPYELKNGEWVYIIKTDLNNSDIKYPLYDLSGADIEKHDYLVLYPVQKGEKKGNFGIIVSYINPNGTLKYRVETNRSWKWQPQEEYESLDLSEMIKRKLRQKLNEQKFFGRGTSSSDDLVGVNTGSGTFSGRDQGTTTTGTQGTQQTTPAKLDPEKVSKVIEPIKQETIVALEEIQNNSLFNNVAKDEDKEQLQQAIDLLNDFDSSKACEQENIDMIDDNLELINNIIKEKGKLLSAAPKLERNLYIVKGNLEKVKSECARLQKQLQSSSGSGAQGTTTSTSGSGTQGTTTSTSSDEQGGDTDLRTMFGFVGPDGKTYSPKAKIKSIDRKGGELAYGTIQNAINNSDARSYYFAEYNDLIDNEDIGEDYKLRFPDDFPEAEYAGQLIDKDNESALYPLEDMALSGEFVKRTFGNFLGTNSDLELIVSKRQGSTMQSARQKCPYNQETIRTYIIDYLYRGLTPGNRPASNEKKTLCACYSEGMFNNFKPVTKDELGAIADNLKPFGLLNRRLNFREITKLIQGGTVSGKELSSVFVDSNFATKNCKGLRESKLNRNINSLITEAVTTKRKERTREVIVEDLLRTIRGY